MATKKMQAVVVQDTKTKQISVQFGYNDHEGQLDRSRPHWEIPFADAAHAWAVADAYNYPEHNVNNWRAV